MAIVIQPYTADLVPAVKAFNQRLEAGGIARAFYFPEQHVPCWLPKLDGRRIYQEFYLAVEDESVRGGFSLKYQDFWLRDGVRTVGFYQMAISEGIVNRTYFSVGVQMLRHAGKAQPMLFALGMGGFDRPLPRMLKAMGWSLSAMPFYFKVNDPAAFIRNIAALRRSAIRRSLASFATRTGLGWMTIKTAHWMRSRAKDPAVCWEEVAGFGCWADELWENCSPRYLMIASRDSGTLNILYPSDKNFIRLRVSRESHVLGWAVLLDTQMAGNKYFGDLRVGSIVDCLAAPEHAFAVIQAATQALQERGVELIVSNQSHAAWGAAFRSAGFLPGPSNFIFAASRKLAEKLGPLEKSRQEIFFNRGDGDGPVNL